MKKTLASLAIAGILTFSMGTVAAQAAPSYPAGPSATVSSGTVVPGQNFVFGGSGFKPGETIDITITQSSPVAGGAIGSLGGGVSMSVPMIIKPAAPVSMSATAAADGSFSSSVALNATGTYTLTATGRESGVTVSQVVKVVTSLDNGVGNGTNTGISGNVASGTNNGDLASTGVDTSVLVWSIVGAGALVAGVGTVVVSRRRRSNTVDA